MSASSRPRPFFRTRSRDLAGFDAGSSFTSLGSLGVTTTAAPEPQECTLENCACLRHLAELVQSFDALDPQAFTMGDFTVTPLGPCPGASDRSSS